MKKGNAKVTDKKEVSRVSFDFLSAEQALASKATVNGNDNVVVFDLVARDNGKAVVTLTIWLSDRDYDMAKIDICGFSITGNVRAGKNGMFFAFPETKTKKGDYFSLAACYDSAFHALMKELLAKFYE